MIPYGKHFLDEDDIEAVICCLRDGPITQGPIVSEFEERFADFVGARFAVAVSSGTAALHIAAIAAGFRQDDVLVTSNLTFVSSANIAHFQRGKAVFTDIIPETLNMDPESAKELFEKQPGIRLLVPVHFGGTPCDMVALAELANDYGCLIVEDASHALGAEYSNGKKVGSCCYSAMTTFSFHPVKAIATGEGGIVTTNDEQLCQRLLRLRSHGINKGADVFYVPDQAFTQGVANRWYYEMQELGFNYRMTDFQSALGISQIKKAEKFIRQRRYLASVYDHAFKDESAITLNQVDTRHLSAHHLYTLSIDFGKIGISRTEFMGKLMDRGIGSQVHYIPVVRHPFYLKQGFDPASFPNVERYYSRSLSIPMFYSLSSDQQEEVIDSIKYFCGG